MSGGRTEGHAASFGPGESLLAVDADRYETTQAAVQAALKRCPRFCCPECELEVFCRPAQCRNCGTDGSEFAQRVPAEEGES